MSLPPAPAVDGGADDVGVVAAHEDREVRGGGWHERRVALDEAARVRLPELKGEIDDGARQHGAWYREIEVCRRCGRPPGDGAAASGRSRCRSRSRDRTAGRRCCCRSRCHRWRRARCRRRWCWSNRPRSGTWATRCRRCRRMKLPPGTRQGQGGNGSVASLPYCARIRPAFRRPLRPY